MPGKVSMVVPCYNKADFIGPMLDSVIAQTWDWIELILVNDGSDDGTRSVMAAYEPQIRARGYELIIIDQENQGCCGAVYAGMRRMTGDYFCLVDSDDALDPAYVSLMAGWLDAHEDYAWTICSYRPYLIKGGQVEALPVVSCANMADNVQLLERHILRQIITTSWAYMTRTSYIQQCRLMENFCTERRKTYEPLFAVPLMLGGGRLKCFEQALYRFNRYASDMYVFDTYEKVEQYYTDYTYLYRWGIDRADVGLREKARLHAQVQLGHLKDCLYHLNSMDAPVQGLCDSAAYKDTVSERAALLMDRLFDPKPCLSPDVFTSKKYAMIMSLFCHISMQRKALASVPTPAMAGSRYIAYGVLGKVAVILLPSIMNSCMRPALYWDEAAGADTEIFGEKVTQPSFDQLNKKDVILVFPRSHKVVQYVQANSRGARVVEVTNDCYQFVF